MLVANISGIGLEIIVTNDLQRVGGEPECLLDHPQRLGILPTKWFWRGENWRRARWLLFIPLFIVFAAANATGSILLAVAAPPIALALMTGLLEKYIRHQALKRRRALGQASYIDERRSKLHCPSPEVESP